MSYSRADFFHTSKDTRGLGVFLMVFPSAVTMLVIGANKQWENLFALIMSSVALVILLLSGYRSAVLQPLLIGIIVWTKVGRKIPVLISVSIVFLVIIMIPVIGMFRGMGPYDKLNVSSIEKSMEKTNAQDTFVELGGTAGVLAHVFRLVPETDSYRYGMTYVKAFRDSIPNIMPQMSESDRLKARQGGLLNPSMINEVLAPGEWITYRVDRARFIKGEGIGFSAIGEPYINFGAIGVIIYFMLIGFLLGRLDSVNILETPNILIFSCSMLGVFMGTVRGDLATFIKPAIFITIILIIWRTIMRIFNLSNT
jgi:oligosaccharide repeat unit polymerase